MNVTAEHVRAVDSPHSKPVGGVGYPLVSAGFLPGNR
jgi:hypothetical protein